MALEGVNAPVKQVEIRGWNFALMPGGWVRVAKQALLANSILFDRQEWDLICQELWLPEPEKEDEERGTND